MSRKPISPYRSDDLRAVLRLLSNGHSVAVVGMSNFGKSTLLRTMAGMQNPLSGRVLLNGQSIHHMDASERARRLSVVLTQKMDVGLFTGYGLVAMGRHPYTDWTGRLSRYDEAMEVLTILPSVEDTVVWLRQHAAPDLMFVNLETTVADLERELEAAGRLGRTVMLDFYADWCVDCKRMERYTFPEPVVQAALDGAVLDAHLAEHAGQRLDQCAPEGRRRAVKKAQRKNGNQQRHGNGPLGQKSPAGANQQCGPMAPQQAQNDNENQRLHRELLWAQFKNGKPVYLDLTILPVKAVADGKPQHERAQDQRRHDPAARIDVPAYDLPDVFHGSVQADGAAVGVLCL